MQANRGKLQLAERIYDLFRIAHNMAGGIVINAPLPEELSHAENRELIAKYYAGRDGVGADQRLGVARLLKDLTASGEAGWYAVISAHGGGSPEALRLSAVRSYDLKTREDLARRLTCFAASEDGCSGCGACGGGACGGHDSCTPP